MRIYEDLDGTGEPTGMVDFADDNGVILFSEPKGALAVRAVSTNKVQIFGTSGERLTPILALDQVKDSSGVAYGATVEDVIKALNAFFFHVVELPDGLVIAEEVTATTVDSNRVAIYQIDVEEKQAITIFGYGIGKTPGSNDALSFSFTCGASRDTGAAEANGKRPQIDMVTNFNSVPRINHSVSGNTYFVEVDSRAAQTINWSMSIIKKVINV